MTSLLETPKLDTWLARALWQSQRLPADVLKPLLEAARHDRPGSETLAQILVGRGLATREELEELLRSATHALKENRGWHPEGRVGQYRLVRRLGRGGMGEVWLATHVETGAQRALKTLPLGAEPEDVLRFRREGEGQARVDEHPHVVRIHSAGVTEGRAYLVQEVLLDGDLALRLKDGPLPADQAARTVAGLARGMAHVHEQGVLHRDLKPANVLFAGDVAKLTDFGLVKLLGANSLTETGTILGTPAYMAPEQIDPSQGAVTELSDVYGLGAILYETLTGRPPFVGATPMDVMLKIVQAPHVPPRALRSDLPATLEAICVRALSKSPDDRQSGAAELASELEAFLAGADSQPAYRIPLPLGLTLLALGAVAIALLFFSPAAAPDSNPPSQSPALARSESTLTPAPSPAPISFEEEQSRWLKEEYDRWEKLEGTSTEAQLRLQRLAALNHPLAMTALGHALLRGGRDKRYARCLLLRAAAGGCLDAYVAIVDLAQRGELMTRSAGISALVLLRPASKSDLRSEVAKERFGQLHHVDVLRLPPERARAALEERLLRYEQDLRDDSAQAREIVRRPHVPDGERASALERLALSHDPDAMAVLSRDLAFGTHGAAKDPVRALWLAHLAAQAGSRIPCASLALTYVDTSVLQKAEQPSWRFRQAKVLRVVKANMRLAVAAARLEPPDPSESRSLYAALERAGIRVPTTDEAALQELVRASHELGF